MSDYTTHTFEVQSMTIYDRLFDLTSDELRVLFYGRKNKTCSYPGCMNRSLYRHLLFPYKTHCSLHKTRDMTPHIKSKLCRHLTCDKHASCGFLDDRKRKYCTKHMKKGMVVLTVHPKGE